MGSVVDLETLAGRVDDARTRPRHVGGVVEVRARGVPPGLGSYATREERLDGRLAAALMGIQAVKGVEIGDGFALAGLRGSEAHDEIVHDDAGLRRQTNRAGGIEGGVSNGEEVVVRAAMKPLPTFMRPLQTVDLATGEAAEALVERSDTAAVEALAVVAEAAVAFELARAAREKFGGDALGDFVGAHTRTWSGSTGAPVEHRHLALIGFMGAGKSTLGAEVARALGRPFVDLDAEIERHASASISTIFATRGRSSSARSSRSSRARRSTRRPPAVISSAAALWSRGDGAALRERALTVFVEVDVDEAWKRRAAPPGRPLAERESEFRQLFEQRLPLYEEAADAALGPKTPTASCWRPRASSSRRLRTPVSLSRARAGRFVVDERVRSSIRRRWRLWTHAVPAGEQAKPRGLRSAVAGLAPRARRGHLVAVGGGSTTDVGGYVAAGYLGASPGSRCRRRSWARWTRRSEARPASTFRRARTSSARSIGRSARWSIPSCSRRCPRRSAERHGRGREDGPARRRGSVGAARARGASAPLRRVQGRRLPSRPAGEGERAMLNLGHTFAHALEAASEYACPTVRPSRSA